jgi:hypothetical protein
MAVLGKLAALVEHMVIRRRLHWVEISVEKAWTRDASARHADPSTR